MRQDGERVKTQARVCCPSTHISIKAKAPEYREPTSPTDDTVKKKEKYT